MRILPLTWQRLVNATGQTCPRCRDTGAEVQAAVDRLHQVLAPLGIEPRLDTIELDESTFLADPVASNRILINGQPLEHWLVAQTGSSPCCEECGDNDCRTLAVNGQTFEVIPEALVVRAGLIAATRMLDPTLPS
jgi:hypothetical protein